MEWLTENWLLVLIGVLFIGMHLFHGGHGRHGKQNDSDKPSGNQH